MVSEAVEDLVQIFPIEPTPGVFLGSRKPTTRLDVLMKHRISHIINCAPSQVPNSFPNEFTYLNLNLSDKPQVGVDQRVHFDDIAFYFDESTRFIGEILFEQLCLSIINSIAR
jgi:hypothetical protein